AEAALTDFVESVGICFFTNAEDIFMMTKDFARRLSLASEFLEPCQNGEEIRNWAMDTDLIAFKPYYDDWTPIKLREHPREKSYLEQFRKPLGNRATFSGKTYDEEGKLWYGYHIINYEKLRNA